MHFLVQSQLWIALGAFSLTMHTNHSLGESLWLVRPSPLLVFGATLSTYALLQWHSLNDSARIERYPRLVWPLMAAIGAWLVLQESAGLSAPSVMVLIGAFILVAGYAFPLPGGGRSLRARPYVKVFLIAAVWTLATALLPVTALPPERDLGPHVAARLALLLCARFAFILAITLPFDLRDLKTDRREGILTLPLRLGWPATRRIALAALGASLAAELVMTLLWPNSGIALGSILAMHGAAGMLILYTHGRRRALYYGLWLDGVLVIPLAMALISGLIHR